MKKSTRKVIVAFFVIAIVVVLILFGFYMLSKSGEEAESELPSTEIEILLAKDLELSYPETPSEVVKMYWRINKCMYNENAEMTDENFEALLKQLRMLYDDEFLDVPTNSWEFMLEKFKTERKNFLEKERMISSYAVQEDEDVEYGMVDGKEGATLYVDVLEVEGEENARTRGEFICRKDSEGNWKILGWEQVSNSEKTKKE